MRGAGGAGAGARDRGALREPHSATVRGAHRGRGRGSAAALSRRAGPGWTSSWLRRCATRARWCRGRGRGERQGQRDGDQPAQDASRPRRFDLSPPRPRRVRQGRRVAGQVLGGGTRLRNPPLQAITAARFIPEGSASKMWRHAAYEAHSSAEIAPPCEKSPPVRHKPECNQVVRLVKPDFRCLRVRVGLTVAALSPSGKYVQQEVRTHARTRILRSTVGGAFSRHPSER